MRDPAPLRDPFFSPALLLWSLAATLLVTAVAYWPGLSGPWLFDDSANLNPVRSWLDGEISWREVVFNNTSGPGGRPVSMATFLLSAGIGGYTPFAFKLGNLLLHLFNGMLVFALCRAMLRRDRLLGSLPLTAPLVVAALWLLHPLLVSTTLYAVQRMAMLSATLMLLAMLAYLHGRMLLEDGRASGWIWLFLLVPLLSACAFLAKENGLIAPLLCGVVELVYFAPRDGKRRPTAARLFLLLGVALPIAAGLLALAIWPDRFIGGYGNRSFTLVERALTQPRVLFDYASSLLLPWGPRLSLFRDNYPLSTGLLAPATTLLALLGWSVLIATAIALRKRIPAFPAGLGIFLVGHSLESSIFPLLIYFEHRNYLPAVGLLWAAAGLVVATGKSIAPHMHRPQLVFGGAAFLLVVAFAIATHARATVWQSMERLLVSSLRHHPESNWLRTNIAQLAMDARPQRPDIAREHLQHLLNSPQPGIQQMGWMGLTAIDCLVDRRVEPERSQRLFDFPGRPLEADLMTSIENTGNIVRRGQCEGLPPGVMAQGLDDWLDRSDLSEGTPMKSRLRYQAATLHAAAGDYAAALEQADIAWNAGRRELAVGGLRVGALIGLGRLQEAGDLLEQLQSRPEAGTGIAKEFLDAYQAQLEDTAQQAEDR